MRTIFAVVLALYSSAAMAQNQPADGRRKAAGPGEAGGRSCEIEVEIEIRGETETPINRREVAGLSRNRRRNQRAVELLRCDFSPPQPKPKAAAAKSCQ